MRSSRFLSFSRQRDGTSERAKKHAWGEQKKGRGGEGVSEKGERVHSHAVSFRSRAFWKRLLRRLWNSLGSCQEDQKTLIDAVECNSTACIGVSDTEICVRR